MLSGDFRTMALADVLQWADSARARGLLRIRRTHADVWMMLADRHIQLAALSPSQPVKLDERGPTSNPTVTQRELALEHLYDQFLDPDGSFSFEELAGAPESGVELDVYMPELLMEGMRILDEWPRLDKQYASDSPRLHLGPVALPDTASNLKRELVACARRESTLSAARLSVGLSRPAFLRRIDELRGLDYVVIDGAPAGGDLIAKLLSQATLLLAAKQFDEAAHVFSALLAADPGAPGVKNLLQRAEAEQLEFLRALVPADAVPSVLRTDVDRNALTTSDRVVLDLVNGNWPVTLLVLSSPLRETESLKSLNKLTRLGVLRLGYRQR